MGTSKIPRKKIANGSVPFWNSEEDCQWERPLPIFWGRLPMGVSPSKSPRKKIVNGGVPIWNSEEEDCHWGLPLVKFRERRLSMGASPSMEASSSKISRKKIVNGASPCKISRKKIVNGITPFKFRGRRLSMGRPLLKFRGRKLSMGMSSSKIPRKKNRREQNYYRKGKKIQGK